MRQLLPGCAALPVPSAAKTQRAVSRAAFTAISTGSTAQHEGLAVVRAVSQLPLNAVDRTTPVGVSDARRRVDARFDDVQEVSDRAEDRVLSAMLSTSRRTYEYAELLDDSVETICPVTDEAAT